MFQIYLGEPGDRIIEASNIHSVHLPWIDGPMSRFRAFIIYPSPSSFFRLSLFLSVSHRENAITSLLSSTHPEHSFCPFVFNNSSRAIFIFNISSIPRFRLGPYSLIPNSSPHPTVTSGYYINLYYASQGESARTKALPKESPFRGPHSR